MTRPRQPGRDRPSVNTSPWADAHARRRSSWDADDHHDNRRPETAHHLARAVSAAGGRGSTARHPVATALTSGSASRGRDEAGGLPAGRSDAGPSAFGHSGARRGRRATPFPPRAIGLCGSEALRARAPRAQPRPLRSARRLADVESSTVGGPGRAIHRSYGWLGPGQVESSAADERRYVQIRDQVIFARLALREGVPKTNIPGAPRPPHPGGADKRGCRFASGCDATSASQNSPR
jgi:hypothetical protein